MVSRSLLCFQTLHLYPKWIKSLLLPGPGLFLLLFCFVSQQTLLLSHWLGLCLSRGHHWLEGTFKSEGGDCCWTNHLIVCTILPECPKEQMVENNFIA